MKKKLTLALNLFLAVMSLLSWLYMAFIPHESAALSGTGLTGLRFFTVLSNLFNGAVCLLYAVHLLRGKKVTVALRAWKLVSTAAVGLTFLTVMGFLGPVYGYHLMFRGANLWMHLILPVAAMLSFVLLEHGPELPFAKTLWAALPPALYSLGYILNILLNGIGEYPHSRDFYGFLTWGWGVGLGIACTIIVMMWLIAVVLRALGKAAQKD